MIRVKFRGPRFSLGVMEHSLFLLRTALSQFHPRSHPPSLPLSASLSAGAPHPPPRSVCVCVCVFVWVGGCLCLHWAHYHVTICELFIV